MTEKPLQLLSPTLHSHIVSPLQYPHQVVVWHLLEHFSDCELTTIHSIRGRVTGSQVLYRKCLVEKQRFFVGWEKAMAIVLEIWIWYMEVFGKGPQRFFVEVYAQKYKSEGHVVGTPNGLVWSLRNDRLGIGSSEILRKIGALIRRTLNALCIWIDNGRNGSYNPIS